MSGEFVFLIILFQSFEHSVLSEQSQTSYYIRTETGGFLHGRYDVSATKIGGGKVLDTVMDVRLDETRNILFQFNGPFLEGESYRGHRWCLNCRNGSEGCGVDMHICKLTKNNFWFIQQHPNQTEGVNGQFYFSIHSQLHPTECVTYKGEEMNDFKLEYCEDPPSSRQNFYIEPNYLDLIQEVQSLNILRHFYRKPSFK